MRQARPTARTPISPTEVERVEAFCAINADIRQDIAAGAVRMHFLKKQHIIEQDEASADVYFSISGRVRVRYAAMSGRDLTYQILGPGQLFGELSAIDGQRRSASVIAEDDAVLGKIDPKTFRALLARHPEFALAMLSRLAALSRWLAEKVFEYHAYNVKGRICCELLRLAKTAGSGEFEVTDRDMSSRVGTTRENANRIIAEIRDTGSVMRDGSMIRVTDEHNLRSLLVHCEIG